MAVFSENGKSYYKMTKNYISCSNFCVLTHINVPLLVLSSPFLINFGTLMKFWGNPEIQDGGSKMAAAVYLAFMT